MKLLADEGVYLIKGIREGKSVSEYFLIYKDVVLRGGSLREVAGEVSEIIQKGRTSLSRHLEHLFSIKSGSGGGIEYLSKKVSVYIFGQEKLNSCAAACIRQYAKDHGKIISEEFARKLAKTVEGGTNPDNIGPALQRLFPDKKVKQGALIIEKADGTLANPKETLEAFVDIYKKPFLATILPDGKSIGHTVIVDEVVHDIVYLRDPWGKGGGFGGKYGVEATMTIDDFTTLWHGRHFHYVILY